MKTTALLLAALGLSAIYGCYTHQDNAPAVIGQDAGAAADAGMNGLPCDVADVIQRNCLSCHGAPPSGGATVSLTSYASVVAVASEALSRMRNATMPPTGKVNAADLAVFSAWVDGGTPEGSCGAATAPAPTVVCTSGTYWTRGDHGSELMHPGRACISCHATGGGDDDDDDDGDNKHDHDDAPLFTAAGTVYPTHYEPDDCNGSGTEVTITDANGVSQTLTVNSAGNFYATKTIAMPFTASITKNGQTLTMTTPQTSGDCNGCHTASTSGQGRIVSP